MEINKRASNYLATKIDFYKLFWIFFIGSVLGFVCETIWCFFTHEILEWHSSFIYIPLTAIYGCGAVVLYLGMRIIKSKKVLHLFIFGAVSCTVVEYLCSLLQEMIFGTVSWNYLDVPFNIEGRICLPITIIWGVVAVLWVWVLQPLFERLIVKIPTPIYKPITWTLVTVILVFTIISVVAVLRWVMRLDGIPPTNILEELLDSIFTDDFMKMFYPKMRFDT